MSVSFRDPDGFVYRSGGRVLRCVLPHAVANTQDFLASPAATAWTNAGLLSRSTVLNNSASNIPSEFRAMAPEGSLLLEHPAVRFPSYPYEWAPDMLHRAAQSTLDMAEGAMDAGFTLKDATPFNFMFEGPRPVFLDVLSFDARDPLDPLWRAYAQFVRTFLYPLLAYRYAGLFPGEILLLHRDGLEPQRMRRMFAGWRLLFPPLLGLVSVPLRLSRRLESRPKGGRNPDEEFRQRLAKDPGEANFLLRRLFRRARKSLQSAAPRLPNHPHAYESEHNYPEAALNAKQLFVAKALEGSRSVLDAGCNTGRFSLIAANAGAAVVSIDHDPEAIGALWRRAGERNLDILPLVVNLARPSAAWGWENRESDSFLERAAGHFDCVLMLALIHHLVVNERTPLDAIFQLAATLTTKLAVIEYIDPQDSQFQRLLRGRAALHRDLNPQAFEAAALRHFAIAASCEIMPTRRIYALEKRAR